MAGRRHGEEQCTTGDPVLSGDEAGSRGNRADRNAAHTKPGDTDPFTAQADQSAKPPDLGGRERFVDGQAVCCFLSIAPRTLSRWLAEYESLPRYRIGGSWRFRLSEIERWARHTRRRRPRKRKRND